MYEDARNRREILNDTTGVSSHSQHGVATLDPIVFGRVLDFAIQ